MYSVITMNYWLFKTEPTSFGIDDLKKQKRTHWDGVRNYQARNMLRDEVRKGDLVIFYHSSCDVPAAVGIAEVVKSGYPDFTAQDKTSEHPDPKSTKESPIWYMVDIAFKKKFTNPISLQDMRTISEFSDMRLLQRGNRLSLFPVSQKHYQLLCELGK